MQTAGEVRHLILVDSLSRGMKLRPTHINRNNAYMISRLVPV